MWSEALCLAYAALAQLVEHRIRIDWLSVYASLWGNLEVKRSLKRGNLNSSAVGNPVLIPVGMSVETLYDPPTAIVAIGEEKVQTTNITISDGNENCSWYECGGRVFKSHRRHHIPFAGASLFMQRRSLWLVTRQSDHDWLRKPIFVCHRTFCYEEPPNPIKSVPRAPNMGYKGRRDSFNLRKLPLAFLKYVVMPALILIVFIDLLGFGLIIPILPFYAEHFGAAPGVVTLLMASYSMMQFISAPFLGSISDRLGRRQVILLSLAGTCAAYLLMACASSLLMLFAARMLAGFFAGNIAAAQAYIADVTEPENRARGMGLFGAAFGLGFIFGPVIGGVLSGSSSGEVNFYIAPLFAAVLSGVAAVLTLILLEEPERNKETLKREGRWFAPIVGAVRQPNMKPLILLFLLVMFVFAGLEATIALWAERQFYWGPREIGYLFAYVGVVAAIVQGGLIGPATRAWGEERVVFVGVWALIAGFVLMPLSSNLSLLLVATALLAGGFGFCNPALNSLISRRASSAGQGAALGVAQSGASLARIMGPTFAGAIFGIWGRHAPYVAGAVILLFATWVAWQLVRARTSSRQVSKK